MSVLECESNLVIASYSRALKVRRYIYALATTAYSAKQLCGSKAGKGKATEYTSEDIPDGPMDRFTSQGTFSLAPVESSVLSESDLDNEDEDDDFVVADDIIDGQKTTTSQQETSELPGKVN